MLARASLRAAVVAVDPSFVNFTISALAIVAANRSAQSSSIFAGRVKLVPRVEHLSHGIDHLG